MNNKKILFVVAMFSLIVASCKEDKETEKFKIYSDKEIICEKTNTYKMVTYKDKEFLIKKEKSVKDKLSLIADTLSKSYFNNLEISIKDIYEDDNNILIANIDLIENPDYDGPGSVPSYNSWYDHFQGSYGGRRTTILLKENLLQRNYEGVWIDGLVFFYEGDSIRSMAHLNLNGIVK